MTTLADLRDAVLAAHVPRPSGLCGYCGTAPCAAYRLAAALSPENVAAGLQRSELEGFGPELDIGLEEWLIEAAALLAAITVAE